MKKIEETPDWRDVVIYIRDCATPIRISDSETGVTKIYRGADYFEEVTKAWCKYHCLYVVGIYHDTEEVQRENPSTTLKEAVAHCRRKKGGASILVVPSYDHIATDDDLLDRIGEELYDKGVHVREVAGCKHVGFTVAMGIREVEWKAEIERHKKVEHAE